LLPGYKSDTGCTAIPGFHREPAAGEYRDTVAALRYSYMAEKRG